MAPCLVCSDNKAEVKNCKDKPLIDLVSAGKKKCRRIYLNDKVSPPLLSPCCDNRSHLPVISLRFITPVKAPKKDKKEPIREVPEQTVEVMKAQLLAERENMVAKALDLLLLVGLELAPKIV